MTEYLFRHYKINYEKEYKFHPTRKWRFDFCLVAEKIAIELEGGIFIKGRHVRGVGYQKDCEKYRAAVLLGWRVLRYTTNEVAADPEMIIRDIKELT